MGQRGKQNVTNVDLTATQMCFTAPQTISNAYIVAAWGTTKDVAGWPEQIEDARRRSPGIDAGQALVRSRIRKNLTNTLF